MCGLYRGYKRQASERPCKLGRKELEEATTGKIAIADEELLFAGTRRIVIPKVALLAGLPNDATELFFLTSVF